MDPPATPTGSSSAASLYTTSSSTQWGPGAIAGKAILAMGKATLRSVEHLIISRRIAAIKVVIPCADDDESQPEHLEKMFADLLELTRPTLYPDGIRIQATQILLAQIATEQTHRLRLSISKWDRDFEELSAFLREIIAVALFSSRGFPDARLVDVYTAALSKDLHPWTACISFISQLAQMNERTFQMALNAQLLDILVWVSGQQIRARTSDTRVEAYCNVAFTILSTAAFNNGQHDLWHHHMSQYCPENSPASLSNLVHLIAQQERWLIVERRLLEKHVHSMLRNIANQSSLSNFGDLYLDSQRYSIPRLADAPPSLPSIRTLMWYIGIGGAAQNQTIIFLSALSYAKKVAVLDQMMRDLVIQFILQPPTPYSRLAKRPEFIAYVVQFLQGISQYSPAIQDTVIEASLLQIIPFLAPPWEPRRIYEDICRRVHSRAGLKSSETCNPQTRSLLAVIQSMSLVEALSHEVGAKTKISLGQLLEPIFSTRSMDPLDGEGYHDKPRAY
ncbi:hypothetical protein FB451DRAFT_1247634 [Mycena latifolia]|nr:hypothetical protein FB451DRAFT_1247634 [Mycena latifolia]